MRVWHDDRFSMQIIYPPYALFCCFCTSDSVFKRFLSYARYTWIIVNVSEETQNFVVEYASLFFQRQAILIWYQFTVKFKDHEFLTMPFFLTSESRLFLGALFFSPDFSSYKSSHSTRTFLAEDQVRIYPDETAISTLRKSIDSVGTRRPRFPLLSFCSPFSFN